MVQPDRHLVPYHELHELGMKSLKLVGVPLEHAQITMQLLLWADLRGFGTHGVERLLSYVPRLQKGLINPRPNLKIETKGESLRLVQGDNGLGPVVAFTGIQEAMAIAKKSGIGLVGCRESNHFGAAAPYVLMACAQRLIAITSTNAFPTMAPTGGLDSLVGNNPLAIGVPADGGSHFVLDMAMSVSSRGRIREMAARGEQIPPGWAITREGRPTTDPHEALRGLVLPIGQHKGYGLAVAMDILCGVITGAGFGRGIKSLFQDWSEPQHIGHIFITIDPQRFMPWDVFAKRMGQLYGLLKSSTPIDPKVPVILPGELESRLEEERKKAGIPVEPEILAKLRKLVVGEYDFETSKY